jgi:hypothetical protein
MCHRKIPTYQKLTVAVGRGGGIVYKVSVSSRLEILKRFGFQYGRTHDRSKFNTEGGDTVAATREYFREFQRNL